MILMKSYKPNIHIIFFKSVDAFTFFYNIRGISCASNKMVII